MTNSKIGPYGARTYGVNVKHGLGSLGSDYQVLPTQNSHFEFAGGWQCGTAKMRCVATPPHTPRDEFLGHPCPITAYPPWT